MAFLLILVLTEGVASRPAAPAVRLPARSAPRMSTASKPIVTSAEQVNVPWDRASWAAAYRTAPSEDSYSVQCDELPADLVGTFFRNIPAKFEVGEQRVMHPFDGDGMIAALTLDGTGKAHFRNRFVRTRGFVREQMAGKMLYPGQFGNPRPVWAGGLEVCCCDCPEAIASIAWAAGLWSVHLAALLLLALAALLASAQRDCSSSPFETAA